MSVVAHRSADRTARVPAQRTAPVDADPAVRRVHSPAGPAIRRVRVHSPGGPPSRVRVAGAPRVLAVAECEPRRRPLPVAWLLLAGVVVCLAVLGLGMLGGAGAPSVPDRTTVVRVEPGENLWELATRVAPDSDTAAVVDRIEELNAIEGVVHPGQPLRVPTED